MHDRELSRVQRRRAPQIRAGDAAGRKRELADDVGKHGAVAAQNDGPARADPITDNAPHIRSPLLPRILADPRLEVHLAAPSGRTVLAHRTAGLETILRTPNATSGPTSSFACRRPRGASGRSASTSPSNASRETAFACRRITSGKVRKAPSSRKARNRSTISTSTG